MRTCVSLLCISSSSMSTSLILSPKGGTIFKTEVVAGRLPLSIFSRMSCSPKKIVFVLKTKSFPKSALFDLTRLLFVHAWYIKKLPPPAEYVMPKKVKKLFPLDERWLTVEEICSYLSVTNETVYKWIACSRCLATGWGAAGCSKRMKWTNGCVLAVQL
mgnify:FL=1